MGASLFPPMHTSRCIVRLCCGALSHVLIETSSGFLACLRFISVTRQCPRWCQGSVGERGASSASSPVDTQEGGNVIKDSLYSLSQFLEHPHGLPFVGPCRVWQRPCPATHRDGADGWGAAGRTLLRHGCCSSLHPPRGINGSLSLCFGGVSQH